MNLETFSARVRRVASLLNDPHPGLTSWALMLGAEMKALALEWGYIDPPAWRDQPPTEQEMTDPEIVGWLHRREGHVHLCAPRRIVARFSGYGIRPDGARTIDIIFFDDGQWCPIYAPEEP